MTTKTTCIKGAYLDRRLVEEDEEELMAAQRAAALGDDRALELYAERVASRNYEYIEHNNYDDEYKICVRNTDIHGNGMLQLTKESMTKLLHCIDYD